MTQRFVACSAAETAEHLDYLVFNNPQTTWLQHGLQLGAPLSAASVSVDELGDLDTFWRTLGEVRPATIGRDVFRVRDSFAAMHADGEPGRRDLVKVAHFTELEAAGQLRERITLQVEYLDSGPNLRIIDGNHQAVAIFEHARAHNPRRQVLLYLVGDLPVT